jgi:hypothetical protein
MKEIIVSIYKGTKRLKVFNMSKKTFFTVLIVNSILIFGFLLFFLSYVLEYGKSTELKKENKTLKKEIKLLKK